MIELAPLFVEIVNSSSTDLEACEKIVTLMKQYNDKQKQKIKQIDNPAEYFIKEYDSLFGNTNKN